MTVAGTIRAGGWAGGVVTAPPMAGTGPAPGISGWLLTYIQPLRTWFDDLVGDPLGVEGVAEDWTRVEIELNSIADEVRAARRHLEVLDGTMIRVLDTRYEDLVPAALSCAEWSGTIAAAARLALSVVAGTREFVLDSLYQIERLIGALFGFSLSWNPFEKWDKLNELIDAASELWNVGAQLIDNMFDAFQRLIDLLTSLGPVIDELLTLLRRLVAEMQPALGGIKGLFSGESTVREIIEYLPDDWKHLAPVLAGLPPGLKALLGGGLGIYRGGVVRDRMLGVGDVLRYDDEAMDELVLAYEADPDAFDGALAEKIVAWRDAKSVTTLDSFGTMVGVNGTTDALGLKDSTNFDIKRVRAEDGSEHWVVAFPSTKEWLDWHGQGGMNDGKNNIALMLHDGLDSQYERAALQAMREAGIADGDPVVFTGFSQGGIAAAKFAASDEHPYTPIGVVTNGAPAKEFDIPNDIPVVAFEHSDDPVAGLYRYQPEVDYSNVETVELGSGGHDISNYVGSINAHDKNGELWEEYSWLGGEVIDHQIYGAVQQ